MKRTFLLFAGLTISGLMLFTSCGTGTSASFKDQETCNKAKELILKEVGDDGAVSQIIFTTGELETKFASITVNIINPEKPEESKEISIIPGGQTLTDVEDLSNLIKDKQAVGNYTGKVKDLNFTYILETIKKAQDQIAKDNAETEEKKEQLDYVTTSSMLVNFSNDPKNMTYFFTQQYTPKAGKTTTRGRTVTTNYYELSFTADAAGNVIYVD